MGLGQRDLTEQFKGNGAPKGVGIGAFSSRTLSAPILNLSHPYADHRTLVDRLRAGEKPLYIAHQSGADEVALVGMDGIAETLSIAEFQRLEPSWAPDPANADNEEGTVWDGLQVLTEPRVRLLENERGIVLGTGICYSTQPAGEPVLGVDLAELRAVLFLFDKIDWPKTNLFKVLGNAETDFLENEGILGRSGHSLVGAETLRHSITDADLKAWEWHERDEPRRWALGRGASAAPGELDEGDAALFTKLANVIAVPAVEVPLQDVLEFRLRRRAELLALRTEIDRAYGRIVSSADRAHAWMAESDALITAVADQRRVAAEAGWRTRLGSVASSMKVGDLQAAGVAAFATLTTGGSVSAALIAGTGALSLSASISLTKKSEKTSPVDYIMAIEKEFGPRAS